MWNNSGVKQDRIKIVINNVFYMILFYILYLFILEKSKNYW